MARLPNPILDVEKELGLALKNVGGIRVDALTGTKTGHRIADFLFDNFQVVAELKCLEKDQVKDKSFIEKASKLYVEARKKDKSLPIIFGTGWISSEQMSAETRKRMDVLYTAPIRRVISSANDQIEQTKKILNRDEHRGVLFLVNNGNTALDPSAIVWVLGECLKGKDFKNINHVIFFTVNMAISIPQDEIPPAVDSETDLHVWYSGKRSGFEIVPADFEPAVRKAWFDHLGSKFGRSQSFEADKRLLHMMKNNKR